MLPKILYLGSAQLAMAQTLLFQGLTKVSWLYNGPHSAALPWVREPLVKGITPDFMVKGLFQP